MGHLILSRKRHEEIRIGADVVIKVLEIRGVKVRLGIHAPDDMNIVRTELEMYDPLAVYQPEGNDKPKGKK